MKLAVHDLLSVKKDESAEETYERTKKLVLACEK